MDGGSSGSQRDHFINSALCLSPFPPLLPHLREWRRFEAA
ncbi:hypothetical protein E2C01_076027 [Portunus trituberculatus]|uniref:Uncharacterized protein n=1 Tax=Portunus trituberculatus TaxID=210409 RepID=A0A5B7IC63_PORTR|nr:hypothetical protein [Portunus trituberculatus]